MARTIRIVPTVILAAAVLLTAGIAAAFTRDPAPVFVNELHYDNTGVDQNEAVEIAGPAEFDLIGWRLVLYNGSDGVDYFTQELSGIIPDQGGGFGTMLFGLPTANFQNGAPDGLALVDADGQVLQLLSYEGMFRAGSDAAASLDSTDLGVSEPGNTPLSGSRCSSPARGGSIRTSHGPDLPRAAMARRTSNRASRRSRGRSQPAPLRPRMHLSPPSRLRRARPTRARWSMVRSPSAVR